MIIIHGKIMNLKTKTINIKIDEDLLSDIMTFAIERKEPTNISILNILKFHIEITNNISEDDAKSIMSIFAKYTPKEFKLI